MKKSIILVSVLVLLSIIFLVVGYVSVKGIRFHNVSAKIYNASTREVFYKTIDVKSLEVDEDKDLNVSSGETIEAGFTRDSFPLKYFVNSPFERSFFVFNDTIENGSNVFTLEVHNISESNVLCFTFDNLSKKNLPLNPSNVGPGGYIEILAYTNQILKFFLSDNEYPFVFIPQAKNKLYISEEGITIG